MELDASLSAYMLHILKLSPILKRPSKPSHWQLDADYAECLPAAIDVAGQNRSVPGCNFHHPQIVQPLVGVLFVKKVVRGGVNGNDASHRICVRMDSQEYELSHHARRHEAAGLEAEQTGNPSLECLYV